MINRRQLIMLPGAAMASRLGKSKTPRVGDPVHSHSADVLPDKLLLKDYRPKSVYKIPVSEIKKAKFPIIDVHHHATVKTPQDVEAMVKFMDAVGIETTVAFSEIGPAFEARTVFVVRQCNAYAWNNRAGGVGNGSGDLCCRVLGLEYDGRQQ